MKRSGQVVAPLLAAMGAAVMAGCHQAPEMQRCVDEQNRVVAESFCQAAGVKPQVAGNGSGSNTGYMTSGYYHVPFYRYYYGGVGGWNPGAVVSGGSYSSLSGHSYTTSSAVAHAESVGGRVSSGTTRGGFGSSHGGGSGSGEAGSGGGE